MNDYSKNSHSKRVPPISEKLRHKFLFKLTNSLSNYQKYYVMIFMIALALFAVVWGIFQETNERFILINDEARALNIIQPLRNLYENVSQHAILRERYKHEDKSLRSDIRKTQALVKQNLHDAEIISERMVSFLAINRAEVSSIADLKGLFKEWEEIESKTFDASFLDSDKLHRQFLEKVSGMIDRITTAISPAAPLYMVSYYLSQALYDHMPEFASALATHVQLQKPSFNPSQEDILRQLADLGAIEGSYLLVKYNFQQAEDELSDLDELQDTAKELHESARLFESKLDRFFQLKTLEILGMPIEGEWDSSKEGALALDATISFWKKENELLVKVLKIRKNEIFPRKYLPLALSLFITILGFLLGRYFVGKVHNSVVSLDKGFKRLSQGHLETRLPVRYADEIGRASIGFNLMAAKFEGHITELRNIIDATNRLAHGDFSTRIRIDESLGEEIAHVSRSFNKMAKTFEEIISRLKHLGNSLTASADTIAESSKWHEEATLEQEKTTDGILTVINKISGKSHSFVNTMREVNDVVSDMSSYANEGQGSLIKMEAIMKEMVEGSVDIASKLAVLNDKANNINTVIITITKVADQTNLLSLNAAIEADKAQEAGKSFSIIASVIRELADQTATATLDIEKIVGEIMSAAQSCVIGVDDFTKEIRIGVAEVERVGLQLAQIIEQVQSLAHRFESVNAGMEMQSRAAGQIQLAITHLSDRAHTTAESMHRFRVTAEHLHQSAEALGGAVIKLKAR